MSASPKPQSKPSCCARRRDPTWKSWRGVLPWDWHPLLNVAKATPEWDRKWCQPSSQPWIEWVKTRSKPLSAPSPPFCHCWVLPPCAPASPVQFPSNSLPLFPLGNIPLAPIKEWLTPRRVQPRRGMLGWWRPVSVPHSGLAWPPTYGYCPN